MKQYYCRVCKEYKPISDFYDCNKSRCKQCVKVKADINRNNASPEQIERRKLQLKRYRQDKKRELSEWYKQIYRAMRGRNQRKFNADLPFSLDEFIDWVNKNYGGIIEDMFQNYVDSGCDKYLKPSIDHIDDYKGYSFDNMQLMTWKENDIKGTYSRKNKESCGEIARKYWSIPVKQYDENGNLLNVYSSTREAERKTGIGSSTISRCCRRNAQNIPTQSRGYRWEYQECETKYRRFEYK